MDRTARASRLLVRKYSSTVTLSSARQEEKKREKRGGFGAPVLGVGASTEAGIGETNALSLIVGLVLCIMQTSTLGDEYDSLAWLRSRA